MSGPFVYTPQTVPFSSSYAVPFYNQQASPFIPELPLNISPYHQAVPLPPSPNLINSPLPGISPLAPEGFEGYLHATDPFSRRERRGSWNGDNAPYASPWFHVPRRRRSRSDAGYDTFRPYDQTNLYGPYAFTPQLALHPWLVAENNQSELILDLSSPQFQPSRYVGNNQIVPVSVEDLSQPATHPPVYELHIVCDLIPNWPIDMIYHPPMGYSTMAPPPPITVGDVLIAVYNALQMRISQMDWATLSPEAVQSVSRAYTKRCRAHPGIELMLQNQGVKKIDFLLGKIWFKGLRGVGDILKLIVA